jgi:DNA-directed RNA polymerase subunit M/transcription elongation factor TFIIS
MKVCSCGGVITPRMVKEGTVWHCPSCGRYEVLSYKDALSTLDVVFNTGKNEKTLKESLMGLSIC